VQELRTRTKFGDRAFSVEDYTVLPAAVREADSLHSFRRKLKTHHQNKVSSSNSFRDIAL